MPDKYLTPWSRIILMYVLDLNMPQARVNEFGFTAHQVVQEFSSTEIGIDEIADRLNRYHKSGRYMPIEIKFEICTLQDLKKFKASLQDLKESNATFEADRIHLVFAKECPITEKDLADLDWEQFKEIKIDAGYVVAKKSEAVKRETKAKFSFAGVARTEQREKLESIFLQVTSTFPEGAQQKKDKSQDYIPKPSVSISIDTTQEEEQQRQQTQDHSSGSEGEGYKPIDASDRVDLSDVFSISEKVPDEILLRSRTLFNFIKCLSNVLSVDLSEGLGSINPGMGNSLVSSEWFGFNEDIGITENALNELFENHPNGFTRLPAGFFVEVFHDEGGEAKYKLCFDIEMKFQELDKDSGWVVKKRSDRLKLDEEEKRVLREIGLDDNELESVMEVAELHYDNFKKIHFKSLQALLSQIPDKAEAVRFLIRQQHILVTMPALATGDQLAVELLTQKFGFDYVKIINALKENCDKSLSQVETKKAEDELRIKKLSKDELKRLRDFKAIQFDPLASKIVGIVLEAVHHDEIIRQGIDQTLPNWVKTLSSKEKLFFAILLNKHLKNNKNHDINDIIKIFNKFRHELAKLDLSVNDLDLKESDLDSEKLFSGADEMSVAMQRMISMLKHVPTKDRKWQWKKMPKVSLEGISVNATVALGLDLYMPELEDKKKDNSQQAKSDQVKFRYLTEDKYKNELSSLAEGFKTEKEGFSDEDFYAYLLKQPDRRYSMDFYEKIRTDLRDLKGLKNSDHFFKYVVLSISGENYSDLSEPEIEVLLEDIKKNILSKSKHKVKEYYVEGDAIPLALLLEKGLKVTATDIRSFRTEKALQGSEKYNKGTVDVLMQQSDLLHLREDLYKVFCVEEIDLDALQQFMLALQQMGYGRQVELLNLLDVKTSDKANQIPSIISEIKDEKDANVLLQILKSCDSDKQAENLKGFYEKVMHVRGEHELLSESDYIDFGRSLITGCQIITDIEKSFEEIVSIMSLSEGLRSNFKKTILSVISDESQNVTGRITTLKEGLHLARDNASQMQVLANMISTKPQSIEWLGKITALESIEQKEFFMSLVISGLKFEPEHLIQMIEASSKNPEIYSKLKSLYKQQPYMPLKYCFDGKVICDDFEKCKNEYFTNTLYREDGTDGRYKVAASDDYEKNGFDISIMEKKLLQINNPDAYNLFLGAFKEEMPIHYEAAKKESSPDLVLKQLQELKGEGSLSEENKIKLIAYLAEALHLVKGGEEIKPGNSFEINTSQYMAIYQLMSHQLSACEIGTGEGKTRIMMLTLACQALQGKTVDFVTSNMDLSERDYIEFQDFFKALGIETGFIRASSDFSEYKKGGINFSDASNLQLFRNRARATGHGAEVIADKPEQRALVVDENDRLLFDEYSTRYNLSMAADPALKDIAFVYEKMIEVFTVLPSASSTRASLGFNREVLGPPADVATMKALVKEQLSTHVERSRVDKIPDNYWKEWAQSLMQLSQLELGSDYDINHDVLVKTKYGTEVHSVAVVRANNAQMPNASYSNGLHQLLHAYLNKVAKQPSIPLGFRQAFSQAGKQYEFYVDDQKRLAYSSTSKDLLDDYHGSTINAITGTAGSLFDMEELEILYSLKSESESDTIKFDLLKLPRHREFKAKFFKPHLANNKKSKYQHILYEIKQSEKKNQPVLLIAKDDKEAEEILTFVKAQMKDKAINTITSSMDYDTKAGFIQKAGEPGTITISTSLVGRGTDIPVDKNRVPDGLNVLLSYLPNQREMEQIYGRTGRQGKEGMAKMIIDVKEMFDVDKIHKQVSDLLELKRGSGEKEIKKDEILEIYKSVISKSWPDLKDKDIEALADIKISKLNDYLKKPEKVQLDVRHWCSFHYSQCDKLLRKDVIQSIYARQLAMDQASRQQRLKGFALGMLSAELHKAFFDNGKRELDQVTMAQWQDFLLHFDALNEACVEQMQLSDIDFDNFKDSYLKLIQKSKLGHEDKVKLTIIVNKFTFDPRIKEMLTKSATPQRADSPVVYRKEDTKVREKLRQVIRRERKLLEVPTVKPKPNPRKH